MYRRVKLGGLLRKSTYISDKMSVFFTPNVSLSARSYNCKQTDRKKTGPQKERSQKESGTETRDNPDLRIVVVRWTRERGILANLKKTITGSFGNCQRETTVDVPVGHTSLYG